MPNTSTLTATILTGVIAWTLFACTSNPDSLEAGDPLEPFNRQMFEFNRAADRTVVGPTVRFYDQVTPDPIDVGIGNFFTNLKQPVVFANSLLQGRPVAAADTTVRFIFNSTLGIGGIFDVATAMEIPEHNEDFGQTLGAWGVPNGAYIVLPLRWPTTVRDATGWVVDRYPHPYNWNQEYRDSDWMTGIRVLEIVDTRARIDDRMRALQDAPDPYVLLRSSYLQNREMEVRNGQEDLDDLPDFDEFDE